MKRERAVATAIFGAAALLPFALDALGIAPAGYAIHEHHVELFARRSRER